MQTHIKEIYGLWAKGIVLDKHVLKSEYVGDNQYGYPQFITKRSEIGEALFQLKYRDDWSKIKPLAEILRLSFNGIFPEPIEFIVPMPASNPRIRQPVSGLAERLGQLMNVPVFNNILHKTTNGAALKDLETKEEKQDALKDSFSIYDTIENQGQWNVLLLDDLYHTGASMEAACIALQTYPKVKNVYVAALTWR